MATNGLRRTLDRLRKAMTPEAPDEHLLREFIARRDEAAFTALVRRHGPMVLGLSRRVLGNLHDSEDVFQATFLVLAQKARSVLKGQAVASWLYKVAYRIALKARARNEQRRQRERQAAMEPHEPAPVLQDWEVILDEELNRLPEKYRLPVILCDLEGRTRKEVETQLGLAPGTLSSRLTTARRMLAERLTRRGLAVSAGALATLVSEASATATLPPGLASVTAKTAALVAAGKLTAVSSSVLFLMKIGAKAMFVAKLKATLAIVVVLAFVGGGIVYSGGSGQTQPKNDLEALRRENELLRVNLRVTLEKIEAMEKQIAALKGDSSRRLYADRVRTAERLFREAGDAAKKDRAKVEGDRVREADRKPAEPTTGPRSAERLYREALDVAKKDRPTWSANVPYDSLIRYLHEARDNDGDINARRRALDALEGALKKLREIEQKSTDAARKPETPRDSRKRTDLPGPKQP